MQNEMLEVMALKVLRDIALCLQNATFFTKHYRYSSLCIGRDDSQSRRNGRFTAGCVFICMQVSMACLLELLFSAVE